jgi:putative spermidine/putrescine transport system substrate-binding protein
VIPQELLDALPPAEQYANIQFPNAAQTDKATKVIQQQWASKVVGA